MEQQILNKALDWIANGHVGMSSKTMWSYFMGLKEFEIAHPYDPDDFSRCYELLEAIPEWKPRIMELSKLSGTWYKLALNWNKLTEMYEENVRTNWKNYEKIGMFDFMQDLIFDDI